MRLVSTALGAALAVGLAVPATAQGPVQLALVTPIQIVPESQGVTAFRFNLIYSVNQSVQYVDLGLINMTSGGASKGIQWAFVAINKGSFKGWQSALVSQSGSGEGLQWSTLNMSDDWHGLQLGLVNYAKRYHGVQVGLVNIIKEGGQFPIFPIVNWSK